MADETRRDLFKTSIVSALGLTSLAAVATASYEVGKNSPLPSTVPIFEYDEANEQWLIFNFEASSGGRYRVQATKTKFKATPFDTLDAYTHLDPKELYDLPPGPILIANMSVSVTTPNLFDKRSYISAGSSDQPFSTRVTWSEVQKKSKA